MPTRGRFEWHMKTYITISLYRLFKSFHFLFSHDSNTHPNLLYIQGYL
jgi:hypothetical protein